MAGAAVLLPLGARGPGPHQGADAGGRAVPGLADVHVHRRAAATSGKSTSSSRRPAACSSSRSRATPARRRTTARPGCSGTAASCGRSRIRFTSRTRSARSSRTSCSGRLSSSMSGSPSRASSPSSSCPPRTLSAGSMSSSSSASTAATTRPPPRACQGSGTASSTGLRRVKGTASRRPSPSSSRSSCRRSASPALHRVGKVGPYELAAKSFDTGPTWADYIATNPALPNDYSAASASTSPSGPRPTRNGSQSSAPRTASTWRCRESRMTASSGPSSTARNCARARRRLPAREGLAAARPLHGRYRHLRPAASKPAWR